MELLIHSMSEFSSIILPVLDVAKPRRMAEIGSEHGGLTTVLNEWALAHEAHLTSIDPAPSDIFRNWAQGARAFSHVEQPSLDAIPHMKDIDCWFVDGDHNWYTVFHELQGIQASCERDGKPLLVFLHDTLWPCGRRDFYYAPSRIPAPYLREHSYEHGVNLDQGLVHQRGFRGMGHWAWALEAGGPRNGVMTAIEDFARPHGERYLLATIPGVFGMSVLFERNAPWCAEVVNLLIPYHENPLLARLEENRLRNYLRVIEMQDEAAQPA